MLQSYFLLSFFVNQDFKSYQRPFERWQDLSSFGCRSGRPCFGAAKCA